MSHLPLDLRLSVQFTPNFQEHYEMWYVKCAVNGKEQEFLFRSRLYVSVHQEGLDCVVQGQCVTAVCDV